MEQKLSTQILEQRQRLLEWSKMIAECRQSGMSVKRRCSENGTTTKTYYCIRIVIILLLPQKIGKVKMQKKAGYAERIMLEASHIRTNFMGNILGRERQITGMHMELQAVIQILVRVAFRCVRR